MWSAFGICIFGDNDKINNIMSLLAVFLELNLFYLEGGLRLLLFYTEGGGLALGISPIHISHGYCITFSKQQNNLST